MTRPATPDRRLHVVYLGHVARLSGGELALLRTLPALLPDVRATVILAEDGPLVAKLRDAGAEVIVLPLDAAVRDTRRTDVAGAAVKLGSVVKLLLYVWRLQRLLRKLRPDLVHSNTLKSAIYGGLAGRLAMVPVVWHIRDRIADDYLPVSMVRLVRLLSRWLPMGIIANSDATMATLPPRRRRAVLASPVVPDSVTQGSSHIMRTSDQVVIGLIGRLSPWKGQDLFLRAFAEAFRGTPTRARLIGSAMFGEEPYELELRRLATELGISAQVEFRGFCEDVWAEYAELDIAVHCSTAPEPFGQVVLEAMAAQVPIIAANEGGPAEVVTPGVDGWLVEPRDEQALSAAMLQVARDPRLRALLVAGGERTAARYSPERTAAGVLTVYRSLLNHERLDINTRA